MQSTNSAVISRTLTRTIAVASLPWASFLWFAYAGDPYQPVRALALACALAVVLVTGYGRARPAGDLIRWAGWVLAALAALYVGAWFAGGLASGLFGVHGRYAGVLTAALYAAAGLAGLTVDSHDIRTLARSSAFALLGQGVWVLFQSLGGASPDTTFGNRVLLGSWMALAIALAFALARGERGRWRAIEYAAVAVGALALGFVGSRGAWLGAGAGIGVTLLAGRVRGRSIAIVGAAAIAVVLAVALAGGEAAGKLDPASLLRGSAASRVEIWRGTGAMIAASPVLGVGPGRFLYEFPAFEPARHVEIEGFEVRADQAHSVPLQLAAESGIPAALAGLALFGIALLAAIGGTRRSSAASLVCLAGLAAFGGQAAFGISAVETDTLAWLLGGASLALAAATRATPTPGTGARRVVAVGLALAVAAGSAFYLVADVTYLSGLERFTLADFPAALLRYERASALNPLVDVYRVGAADASSYMGGRSARDTLVSLDRGLELEPDSYDLALARARLLGSAGTDPQTIAAAYERAVELYPLGLDVRHEAMFAYVDAGRLPDAIALADGVLQAVPDDPVALQVKELVDE